jgi:hypothetical protein
MKESGVLLNIDVAFKVIRTDTALQAMKEVRQKAEERGNDG